jgi:para-aminobenzoate synthetase component 1
MINAIEPVIQRIALDTDGFYRVAEALNGEKYFVFLDSRLRDSVFSRYSYLAFSPFVVAQVKDDMTIIEWALGLRETRYGNPFVILRELHAPFMLSAETRDALASEHADKFVGGGIGYFGYRLRRYVEVLPTSAIDDTNVPDSIFGLYNFSLILDHQTQEVLLSHFDPGVECTFRERKSLEHALLEAAGRRTRIMEDDTLDTGCESHSVSCLTRDQYVDAVRKIKEYILAGDIYQANFTQRFSVDIGQRSPWQLYGNLMNLNPTPFAAYMNYGNTKILSSSPERFLKVNGRYVETRPIKGTVKRGKTKDDDERLRSWLFNSEKNRSELAMIVDLMRNDIGRVCEIGSVAVEAYPEVETYSSVHHLVSTVVGRLIQHKDIFDLLLATFPGGSITGAPKIRSMEIIDELEPVERGIYTGCIGYIGFNGVVDLNIAIRTIVVDGQTAYVSAGGGIVLDSDPDEEYEESLLKARNLLRALGIEEGSHALLTNS